MRLRQARKIVKRHQRIVEDMFAAGEWYTPHPERWKRPTLLNARRMVARRCYGGVRDNMVVFVATPCERVEVG